ncbi:MAG TPA: EVE domain-containing protein, partial [Chloroflexia bacterium]
MSRAWLFQANPEKYDIIETLKLGEELWNLRQHASAVNVGDQVLIWVCGPDAGIYAVGTVVTPPVTRADSPEGITHWRTPEEGRRPKPRVLVRYDRVLDKPLRKVYLQNDPNLWNMKI